MLKNNTKIFKISIDKLWTIVYNDVESNDAILICTIALHYSRVLHPADRDMFYRVVGRDLALLVQTTHVSCGEKRYFS